MSNTEEHFYEYNCDKLEYDLDKVSEDQNGIERSNQINRFKHYTDHLENISNEINNDTIHNCYLNQVTTYDF